MSKNIHVQRHSYQVVYLQQKNTNICFTIIKVRVYIFFLPPKIGKINEHNYVFWTEYDTSLAQLTGNQLRDKGLVILEKWWASGHEAIVGRYTTSSLLRQMQPAVDLPSDCHSYHSRNGMAIIKPLHIFFSSRIPLYHTVELVQKDFLYLHLRIYLALISCNWFILFLSSIFILNFDSIEVYICLSFNCLA